VSPLANPAEARLRREFVTPEGLSLPLDLAGASDRLVAFVLDALIIAAVLLALLLLGSVLGVGGLPLVIISVFAVTHFYFTIFELRWQGRTPGKRAADLRVIDRNGGRLTVAAIFVRNVTREVEVVLPVVVMLSPGSLIQDAPPLVGLAAFTWLLVLGFFPLFNRDRLRIGDLIAGTIVVHAPRSVLLPDLSERPPPAPRGAAAPAAANAAGGGTPPSTGAAAAAARAAAYPFTAEQLDVYGIYELQVLEEVLRRERPDRAAVLTLVASKVAKKIRWEGGVADPAAFLSAFYAAQRARLEQRLLMGQRKERKSS
jgi:uncharacterized RDD family membrane protein YckC